MFRNISASGNSAFRGAVMETLSCKNMSLFEVNAWENKAIIWGGVLSILNNLDDLELD